MLLGCFWQAEAAWGPAVDLTVAHADVDSAEATASSRPQLRLTIDSAEQLPAAEAVVAALYFKQDAITSLEPMQQVTAAVLADKLGAAAVAKQAVQLLKAGAEAEQGLPVAALEALASLSCWPACLHPLLLPVVKSAACCASSALNGLVELADIAAADAGSRVQRMLLAVLGNLEAVWRDEELQKVLLLLPLPAMQLLLSSDDLRVASEDTVLYTASKFAAEAVFSRRAAATAALAKLVRAPHLSGTVLSGQLLSSSSSTMLLAGYSSQLRKLASYKLATGGAPVPAEVYSLMPAVPAVPAAWRLGTRQLITADPVQLVWKLPVRKIAQACRDSAAGNKTVCIYCPISSPVFGGTAWRLLLVCEQAHDNGERVTKVGLYATPGKSSRMFGDDVVVVWKFTIACTSAGIIHELQCPGSCSDYGLDNLFDVRVKSEAGGWDEAAWAAKGLPVSGEVELTLRMLSVGS
jgi:hypothetical protein